MKMNSHTKSSSAHQEEANKTTTQKSAALGLAHIQLQPTLKLSNSYYYYYYNSISFLILLGFLSLVVVGATEAATPAQQQPTTTNNPKPKTVAEPYPVTSPFLVSTSTSTPTTTTSTSSSTTTTIVKNNIPASQPKTFKFTLTAGRFWKFNIKANSLPHTSQLEGTLDPELRLHRNISLDNYIIDDYGWFQYNPQQQQLFAWPTLLAKPGTYYFVLLPSGLDFDVADDEDSSTSASNYVSANIIVELLRPVYGQPDKKDIDLYLDHKFSLEYLQRLSAYPLLLNQVIAVLDSLTKPQSDSFQNNNNTTQSSQTTHQQPWTTPNPGLVTLASYLQKITKQASKLGEVVLINYSYIPAGNLFSLTWSTHPSILNGTITHIEDCRISLINETVSRLSSLALGFRSYHNSGETNIYYPIDAPLLNLPAIVPTERGNYTLKLKLNGPCRDETAIEKLIEQLAPEDKSSSETGDKDNIILSDTTIKLTNATSSDKNYLSAINSVASQAPALSLVNKTSDSAITAVVSESPVKFITTPDTSTYLGDQQADKPLTTVLPHSKTLQEISSSIHPPSTESPKLKSTSSTVDGPNLQYQPKRPINLSPNVVSPKSPSNIAPPPEVITTSKPLSNGLRSQSPTIVSTPKRVAQPKSFEKFLRSDSPESRERSINMDINNTEVPMNSTTSRNTGVHVTSVSPITGLTYSTTTASPDSTDTTFNEDIMVILQDVMEYFVSIAVPVAVIVGIVLFISIIIAVISLHLRKRRAQHFQVKDRFSFRYGSERKGFLKTSSKPVIMEADQKMISSGSIPLHKAKNNKDTRLGRDGGVGHSNYYPMHMFLNTQTTAPTGAQSTGYYAPDSRYEASSSGFNSSTRNHD